MEYTVTAVQIADELWQVDVAVSDEGDVILQGRTHVCVATEPEAVAYAEAVFLPDLRRNDKRLATLLLPGEQPEEPPVEDGEPS